MMYRNMMFIKLLFIINIFFFSGIFISDAYAYIDPGSGSMIIQILIGALAGVGIAVKVYWVKIKEKISSKLQKN